MKRLEWPTAMELSCNPWQVAGSIPALGSNDSIQSRELPEICGEHEGHV
jgi:hypothetical protein